MPCTTRGCVRGSSIVRTLFCSTSAGSVRFCHRRRPIAVNTLICGVLRLDLTFAVPVGTLR
eukprot:3945661-Prymnesium_polylepis.1